MSIYKNNITLKGFLGKDAIVRKNNSQVSVVILSLATKSSYKDKESGEFVSRTDWHRIVAFGRAAETAKALAKGQYLEVEGELQTREYVPESGDGKRRVIEVRARSVKPLVRAANVPAEPIEPAPNHEEVPE